MPSPADKPENEPFQTYTPAEQTELSKAESLAASSWQAWHDAKQALSASKDNPSDEDQARVDALEREAERRQDELKALQPLC